jgi:hypothetical protein
MFLMDYTKQNKRYSVVVRELMAFIKDKQDNKSLNQFKEVMHDWEAFRREYGFLVGHEGAPKHENSS